jgi:hypothetical protein
MIVAPFSAIMIPLAGRVHRSIIWAKLKCLAEGAAIASKLLWH